ncbi:hypothetical protein QBC47DRAFT_32848 [Echria macrotheca]|uniref:Secreted protein n=1 Tax=Echria macrotheca TaxID=438768 RepID=A0AAJ0BDP8_9PEZI|nr:hypothetical protein QBC47DRAFT_32848 [Echria macrotheca]
MTEDCPRPSWRHLGACWLLAADLVVCAWTEQAQLDGIVALISFSSVQPARINRRCRPHPEPAPHRDARQGSSSCACLPSLFLFFSQPLTSTLFSLPHTPHLFLFPPSFT